MKILNLRFKNLNSLYGEWLIDFTDPEYTSQGIFALTGPTGSGKSTILDAICLALYGATPRLGKITKSSNEIMSRQTGECFSEVLFESQEGLFRCNFNQHRSQKKAGGNLQSPHHEIAEASGKGRVIESQIRKVATAVEEKTGMDFERFTRSILLAQGGFDTFLKADIEQKSKILEQITGTEIYTKISARVHVRLREEREKLTLLQTECGAIRILDPEEESSITNQLMLLQKQEKELATLLTGLTRAISWLNTIDGLEREILALKHETEKLRLQQESFMPERKKLMNALKASELDETRATLMAVRKQQQTDVISLEKKNAALPELGSVLKAKEESLKNAEHIVHEAKDTLKISAPLILKVRALDQKLGDQLKLIAREKESCHHIEALIEKERSCLLEEHDKYKKAQKSHENIRLYLNDNARDEWLISGLAGISEQVGNLLRQQNDVIKKTDQHRKASAGMTHLENKLTELNEELANRKKDLEEARLAFKQGQTDLKHILGDRLLREYRAEKESLLREMAFLTKIAELEDHRARLEDGQPCPLCGAGEHPFAKGNIPSPDKTEKAINKLTRLILSAEKQETVLVKLDATVKSAQSSLSESERQHSIASAEKESTEENLRTLTVDLKQAEECFETFKSTVSKALKPLGIEELPDSGLQELISSLHTRQQRWQTTVQKKNEAEKKLAEHEGELKRIESIIETRNTTLIEKKAALSTLKEEFKQTKTERQTLFGGKLPDKEEARINKAVSDAEQLEKQEQSSFAEAKQTHISVKAQIAELNKQIENRSTELQKLESDFSNAIQNAGFSDEDAFNRVRLSSAQREELQIKANGLDEAQTELKARLGDREARLTAEQTLKVTERTLEELEPDSQKMEEDLKEIHDSSIALKHRLADNADAKQRIAGKQSRIDAHKKECRRWEKLHSLIGSQDGKKFRNFAQGLTFELMVSHANRQLVKMTDRYLLIRDEHQPLELNVVDNYQAGDIRSTKNLSGGESFIVSLTLALGLSKMASRRVRVDSLFLDEGFGTLDEDALETALDTLSSLQQDGKLIGIISHVPALKERIRTQISIIPASGGKSILTGPGCQKVTRST